MNCEQVCEHTSAYLDGELPQQLAAEVRAHLDDCPECLALLEELRSTRDLLARLPARTAPEGLGDEIQREIERRIVLDVDPAAESVEEPAERSLPRERSRVLPRAMAVAAAVVLAVGIGALLWLGRPQTEIDDPRGTDGTRLAAADGEAALPEGGEADADLYKGKGAEGATAGRSGEADGTGAFFETIGKGRKNGTAVAETGTFGNKSRVAVGGGWRYAGGSAQEVVLRSDTLQAGQNRLAALFTQVDWQPAEGERAPSATGYASKVADPERRGRGTYYLSDVNGHATYVVVTDRRQLATFANRLASTEGLNVARVSGETIRRAWEGELDDRYQLDDLDDKALAKLADEVARDLYDSDVAGKPAPAPGGGEKPEAADEEWHQTRIARGVEEVDVANGAAPADVKRSRQGDAAAQSAGRREASRVEGAGGGGAAPTVEGDAGDAPKEPTTDCADTFRGGDLDAAKKTQDDAAAKADEAEVESAEETLNEAQTRDRLKELETRAIAADEGSALEEGEVQAEPGRSLGKIQGQREEVRRQLSEQEARPAAPSPTQQRLGEDGVAAAPRPAEGLDDDTVILLIRVEAISAETVEAAGAVESDVDAEVDTKTMDRDAPAAD